MVSVYLFIINLTFKFTKNCADVTSSFLPDSNNKKAKYMIICDNFYRAPGKC